MTAKVFISYHRSDAAYVGRLAAHLTARGLDTWYDRHIPFGQGWWATIVDRLRAADALVLVMSPELEQSEWATREVMLARREGKPIFPLLLRGQGLPLVIDVQHADVVCGGMPPDDFVDALRASAITIRGAMSDDAA